MANVHFVLRHLCDHGLRTISKNTYCAEEQQGHDDDDDDEMRAELGASSKFTIQIGDAKKNFKGKKGKHTLMDALCAFVRTNCDVGRERVLAVLGAEHYDSESVESDLALDAGNIAGDARKLRVDIGGFLRDYRIGGRSSYRHRIQAVTRETVDIVVSVWLLFVCYLR